MASAISPQTKNMARTLCLRRVARMSGVWGSGPSSKLSTIEWPRSGSSSKGRVRTGGLAGRKRGGVPAVMGCRRYAGGLPGTPAGGPAAAAGGVPAARAGRVGVDAGSAAIRCTAVAVPRPRATFSRVRRSGRM
ncbi:hypothetical protein SMICM304S_05937 [Streptomyces microflavus]